MFVQVMDVYTRYRLGHVLGLPETCQFQVGVLSALLRKYRTFLLARHEFLISVGDLGLLTLLGLCVRAKGCGWLPS